MRSARLLTTSAVFVCFGSAVHLKTPGLDDALDPLWSGDDSTPAPKELARHVAEDAVRTSSPEWARLQVVGPMDSGTNLLTQLLLMNLPAKVVEDVCPVLWHGGDSCMFWKHTPPEDLPSEVEGMFVEGWRTNAAFGVEAAPKTWPPKDPKRDVVLVAMVRSPMAFIGGVGRAPYDLKHCLDEDWANYTGKFCHMRKTVDTHLDGHPHNYHGRFEGLAGAWNGYVHAYHKVQRKAASRHEAGPGLKVLIVEYENLVINPERKVRQIAKAMGVDLEGPFKGLNGKAKHNGPSNGHQAALDNIVGMRYLEKSWKSPMEPLAGSDARAKVCLHLDKQLMRSHHIHTSNGSRSYLADCGFGI